MKRKNLYLGAALLGFVGILFNAVAACMNTSGYQHNCNAVCMNCPQWVAINGGLPCSCRVYSQNVEWNCYRNKNVEIPFPGIDVNVTYTVTTGTCTGGGCIGTQGSTQGPEVKMLYGSVPCNVGG
jgi:hypothetical protein